MSCRTGPLRVGRPLRGGYTLFGEGLPCPSVGRDQDGEGSVASSVLALIGADQT